MLRTVKNQAVCKLWWDVTYIPQKNQSAGGIKRSKHDYCNSFKNETIIKLYNEFRNSHKDLIHHGICYS